MEEATFKRRKELIKNHDLPMLQETKANLGELLGKTVLNTLTPKSQELMGVKKPLSVPPEHLWISPSDHLINNIKLKPPNTLACLKAFTHNTILDYGIEIEKKVQNETEALIENAKQETMDFEKLSIPPIKYNISYGYNIKIFLDLNAENVWNLRSNK